MDLRVADARGGDRADSRAGEGLLRQIPEHPNSTPLIGLAGILLLFTWAELFISPIGLSVTTKLAPEAFRTQMLALFFLSISLGTTVSGLLAGFYSAETEVPYFAFSGITAIVLGGALLAGAPAIRKGMSGVR